MSRGRPKTFQAPGQLKDDDLSTAAVLSLTHSEGVPYLSFSRRSKQITGRPVAFDVRHWPRLQPWQILVEIVSNQPLKSMPETGNWSRTWPSL